MSKHQGFTLIELMIVVAIIGILAAIAMPTYIGYMARAQATEAFNLTDSSRIKLALYYAESGNMDALNSTTADAVNLRNELAALEGRYIGQVGLHDANGNIGIAFDQGALSGAGMLLQPNANNGQIAGWSCSGAVVAGATKAVEERYLPDVCR